MAKNIVMILIVLIMVLLLTKVGGVKDKVENISNEVKKTVDSIIRKIVGRDEQKKRRKRMDDQAVKQRKRMRKRREKVRKKGIMVPYPIKRDRSSDTDDDDRKYVYVPKKIKKRPLETPETNSL